MRLVDTCPGKSFGGFNVETGGFKQAELSRNSEPGTRGDNTRTRKHRQARTAATHKPSVVLTPVVSAVSSVLGGFNRQHEQLNSTEGQCGRLVRCGLPSAQEGGGHCGSVVLMVGGFGGFK